MIKIDENMTIIAGELTEILSEATRMLNRLYFQMKISVGEEAANEYMVRIGQLAVMPEEEIEKLTRDIA